MINSTSTEISTQISMLSRHYNHLELSWALKRSTELEVICFKTQLTMPKNWKCK